MAVPVRVLLVEDDERLGRQLVTTLREAEFDPTWVQRGDDALVQDFGSFGLVVLDLMLPGAHGLDVLKALRQSAHPVPVLVLSARQDASDKVRALELGADDYLTKPFWPEELLARIRARLRRPALAAAGQPIAVGDLRIDLAGRRVEANGVDVELTRAEFEIVSLLARRPGAAVSRSALVDQGLDPEHDGDERTLDVHVSRIRRKLGAAAAQIQTVWGIGYRMTSGAPGR